jgi:hypothetical protein
MAGTAVLRMVVSSDSMKNPTATSQGSSRLAVARQRDVIGICQASVQAPASAASTMLCASRDQPAQMRVVVKAFGVDLVDVLGAGGARREPAAARGHLDAADRRVVARRLRQNLLDRLAGKLRDADLLAVELAELFLLRGVGRRVDAIGERGAQFLRQGAVARAGILAGARRDLGRQQCRHHAVLVGGPGAAVETAETPRRRFPRRRIPSCRPEAVNEPFEAHRHLVQGPA